MKKFALALAALITGMAAHAEITVNVSAEDLANNGMTETYFANGVPFDMVIVAGGWYFMGSNDVETTAAERPVHTVTVETFRCGKTEVTQKLFEAVMGYNPSAVKGDDLPVTNVSWIDSQKFVEKLSQIVELPFRLLNEQEWEYAARGGCNRKGYRYSGSDDLYEVAWYKDNSDGRAHPVATKKANELGIYDMTGNVREWVSDLWSDDLKSERTGGKERNLRVRRGGSWGYTERDSRTTYRAGTIATGSNDSLGLRIAL